MANRDRPRALHHLALRTRDLARLEAFYAGVLGLSVLQRNESRSVWLDAGGVVLMLERASADEPPIPHRSLDLLAFAVEDREPWRASLDRAGVAVESETEHTLYFRDPDGRRLGVSTYPWPTFAEGSGRG